MATVADISRWLNELAPRALAESWDNTGLLLGDPLRPVARVLVCLTLTEATVAEAIEQQAQLVVAHHPLPFRPLHRITTQSQAGKLIWSLAGAGIAVYSAHTAWDSAAQGINASLANKLNLRNTAPLIPSSLAGLEHLGSGRIGELEQPLRLPRVADHLRQVLAGCHPRGIDLGNRIRRIAIACGSGGSLLPAAMDANCDLFITGETSFHTCLEAEAARVSVLLLGHFASERFAMLELAAHLADGFPELTCWPSDRERDPVQDLSGPL